MKTNMIGRDQAVATAAEAIRVESRIVIAEKFRNVTGELPPELCNRYAKAVVRALWGAPKEDA